MTAIPPAPDAPAPSSLPVAVGAGVRVLDGGRVLAGGFPFRVVTLTEEGARALAGWLGCALVGDGAAARQLARRLLDAGILSPQAEPSPTTSALTVVVPARDRVGQLARCLDAVAATCPGSPVIVVDDGSRDRAALQAVCDERGATAIAHAVARGAAAARNTGLAAATTDHVAFVDSDVVVEPGWAEALLGHLADPCVGAVAPRVTALRSAGGIVAGYEQRHSPLDMGTSAGLVGPGRPTPYVPSAVLVGRRHAFGAGFDESLRIGEDVDLVWRMSAAGWRVVYEPGTQVRHDHRLRLRTFAARRRLYARSVAILARRHPVALPAARVSPWMAVPWALALAGRRRAAIGAAAVDAVFLGRRLRAVPGGSFPLASAIIARGLLHTGLGLAQAVRRAWAPPLVVLALRRTGMRRLLLVAIATRIVQDALATRDPRAVAPDVPMRLLDEAIALAGTWEGCVRERTVRPLLLTWRMTGRAPKDVPMSKRHGRR